MAEGLADGGARVGAPEARGAIAAAGEGEFPIGAEGDGVHDALMAEGLADGSARVGAPEAAVPSPLPVRASFPSGLKATAYTMLLWRRGWPRERRCRCARGGRCHHRCR